MIPGVLYISYDGVLEPLGQSQVLAYLERLAAGRRIHLISFEKAEDWRNHSHRDAVRSRMADADIAWHPLRYHKKPTAPATAYDIAVGTAHALKVVARHRIALVHARSYVAGLMALAVKSTTGSRFLFDMRGLWADERVDGGLWPPSGWLYRAAKRVERSLLLAADHVVTLTRASEAEIRSFDYLQKNAPPITVIPTCADLDRFRVRGPLQSEPFVLGYIGSVGTWYLLDEMLRCFVLLRDLATGVRLLIANRGEHDLIAARAAAHGIAKAELELIATTPSEMPAVIARMSAGMALIKPAYSKIASAPTKVGEYLGCGVPCLGNVGVGDVEEVLEGRQVGIAVRDFDEDHLRHGVRRLLDRTRERGIQQRCRAAATELFSLPAGAAEYDRIYGSLGVGGHR